MDAKSAVRKTRGSPALYTAEVLAQLAKHYGCNHTFRRTHDEPQYVPTYLPRGCTSTPRYPCRAHCWNTQAYPNLRALARLDTVEWTPADQKNIGARWRYTPHPDPEITTSPDPVKQPEIVDLDAPGPGAAAEPTCTDRELLDDTTAHSGGRVIDAHDRFTKTEPQQLCRECGQPATHLVLPHVDHRRRKPWPKPYWLCSTHADTAETATAP